MKQVLFAVVLLFGGFALTEMNAQSCCAGKASCKTTASVEKGGSGNGVAVLASQTTNAEKPAASKKACAAACQTNAKGASTTAKGAACNPANCDPSKCSSTPQCDPTKCDPAKCKVEKGS